MASPPLSGRVLRFGLFELNPEAQQLRRAGAVLRIQPQPLKVLTLLVSRAGRVVTREELRHELWGEGTFVDFEQGLNYCIRQIRVVLGDEAQTPRYIETIPRRGYRFIASLQAQPTEVRNAEESAPGGPVAASGEIASGTEELNTSPTALSRFRNRLQQIAILSAVALLLCLAGVYAWQRVRGRVTSAAAMPIRSIAVLPFDNFSGDSHQDYLADGMTDELITDLAQLGSLRVTSRASVMRYRGAEKPIEQIRRDLGVDAIVEGSVVRSGGKVRVDARLVSTSDDRHLWAQSFSQDEQDIIALQDDVARAIAERIEVAVEPSVRARLASAHPVNTEAYEAYLHGISYFAHHSDADLEKSLDYFKHATAIDPTLAAAHAATAEAYCLLADYNVQADRVAWPQAETAARRALELDGSMGKAHAALAFALWRYEWRWKDAEAEFQKALALNPNDSDTHHVFGLFLMARGDFPGAMQQLKTASALDPLSLIIRTNMGWIRYFQRDYATAIAEYQSVLQTDPQFLPAHQKLWIAYWLQGEQQQAGRELESVFRLFHQASLVDAVSARVRAADPGIRYRAEVLGYANSGPLTCYEQARLYALAGEKDAALKSLQKAESERNSWLVYAGVEPAFDLLRGSGQFRRILGNVGLSSPQSRE
jgi:TolB-like protein/DNA-binding winged helix-turn-helix (wHTH) protein